MRIEVFPMGVFQVNSYLLTCENTGKVVAVPTAAITSSSPIRCGPGVGDWVSRPFSFIDETPWFTSTSAPASDVNTMKVKPLDPVASRS